MFPFREGSAEEVLSRLYSVSIRIQRPICVLDGKENIIFTLFSGINKNIEMMKAIDKAITTEDLETNLLFCEGCEKEIR